MSLIILSSACAQLMTVPPATGIRHDVDQAESLAEEILSIVEALDLETCPVTLVYNVPGGQTLTESGRYCLAEDITVTGTGIIIEGNGITLDLNGHSIILTGSSGEIGIAIATDPLLTTTFADIRIKNGLIINIDPPVYVAPMDGSITFTIFTNNVGISVGSGDNIVHDLRLEDITCVALDAGILLNHAINAEIDRVTCESCNVGLLGTNQVSLFMQNSIFNNNVTVGFAVASKPPELSGYSSKVINCVANNNGIGGFVLVSASDFLFQDCSAAENQQNGFIIVASKAISLVNCLAQSQYNDSMQANGFLVTGSTDVIVRECSAINNKDDGFNEDNPANQYYSNYACGNGTNYGGSVLSAPVTSPANARGVHNVDCSNSTVDEVDTILSLVENISSMVDSVAMCPVTLVYDNPYGQSLTNPGRYCLAEDISGTITISANNVILDLNGLIINTSLGYGGDGINVNANFVTIKNGTVTASGLQPITYLVANGITASGVTDLRIENITCYNCFGNAIELDNVHGAIISNVVCDTFFQHGLYLNSSCVDVIVSDSFFVNCQGSTYDAFHSSCSQRVTVQRCKMYNNGTASAISLNGDSDYIISYCSSIKNGKGSNTLAGAIGLQNVTAVVLSNCIAEGNAFSGFSIDSGSTNIVIKECIAISAIDGDGFQNDSSSTQFYANSANGNSGYGFNDLSAGGSQFYANYACDNSTGNYKGVVSAPVTSPANARGMYNVDCSNSALDEVVLLNSKLDLLLTR